MHNKLIDEIKGAKWEVPVGDKLKTFYLEDIFLIDETNLTKEFAEQAALYAYFSGLGAQLDFNLSLISTAKDQEGAAADEFYRVDFQRNDKKVTEAQIHACVIRDEEYVKLQGSETEARRDVAIVKGIIRALEQKANMLVSLGSQLRHEASMDGMYIRDTAAIDVAREVKEKIKARRDQ